MKKPRVYVRKRFAADLPAEPVVNETVPAYIVSDTGRVLVEGTGTVEDCTLPRVCISAFHSLFVVIHTGAGRARSDILL